MIQEVITSPLKTKKYRAIMSDGSKIDFGLKGSSTYLDHKDETKRTNYRVRHLANDKEHYLIKNVLPSPALLSFYLLWGPYTILDNNIKYLNELLK
jgi:hypothetical protein